MGSRIKTTLANNQVNGKRIIILFLTCFVMKCICRFIRLQKTLRTFEEKVKSAMMCTRETPESS